MVVGDYKIEAAKLRKLRRAGEIVNGIPLLSFSIAAGFSRCYSIAIPHITRCKQGIAMSMALLAADLYFGVF